MGKNNEITVAEELEKIRKLLMLQLYYVHEVPAELIGKALSMNANSVRNIFPKEKLKGRTAKKIKKLGK